MKTSSTEDLPCLEIDKLPKARVPYLRRNAMQLIISFAVNRESKSQADLLGCITPELSCLIAQGYDQNANEVLDGIMAARQSQADEPARKGNRVSEAMPQLR